MINRSDCGLTRRDFVRGSAALSMALMLGKHGFAGDPPRLIPRTEAVANLEYPIASLDRFFTPNDLFYVRNHFAAPMLQANTWRLRVEGAVDRELELSLDEI